MRKFLTAGACVLFSAGAASAATSKPNYDAWLDAAPRLGAFDSVRAQARHERVQQRTRRGYQSSFEPRDVRASFLWVNPQESQVPAGIGLVEVAARAEYAARDALGRVAADLSVGRSMLDAAVLSDAQDMGHGAVIARFAQRYNGVEVFARNLAVAMRGDYSPVAVAGYFASIPKVAPAAFSMTAADVVAPALGDLSDGSLQLAGAPVSAGTANGYEYFTPQLANGGDYRFTRPVRVRKVYYALDDDLVPAWYLEMFGEVGDGHNQDAYGYVISAVDGAVLFRKNLMEDAAFSYRVFADTDGQFRPFDGPLGNERAPLETPDPNAQLERVSATAALVTLQSGPIAGGDPWLSPSAVETSGNNVDAYIDRSSPDGFTADSNDLRAALTEEGTFDYAIMADGDPEDLEAQQGAVVNLFYLNNWLHDWWYGNGFDELAGNAQFDNYGRGGVEGDPILAEGQDYSGTDNANMSTPADGGNPRMQMFLWSGLLKGTFEVLTPALGEFPFQVANFGPVDFAVQNQLVVFDDGTIGEDPDTGALGTETDGCEAAVNAAQLKGKIAVIDRGLCAFTEKVQNAQAAGAVAALIVDNIDEPPIAMGGGPARTIRIPAMLTTLTAGTAIRSALVDGPVTALMVRELSPMIDGTIDFQIVGHEWFHYVSNRLVGNASGLSNAQGRGMGEGWSDFSAMMLTVRDSDLAVPSNLGYAGVYGMASYVVDDPYFGIRRAPYSTDFSYNPLTFKHIEDGVPLPDTAPLAFGADGASNAEVHNSGEIWTNVLWEGYAGLLNSGRYSYVDAQELMKDYVIGGLKMTPNAPTFLEARDGILAVAAATSEADFETLAIAFARRGMGVGAVAPDRGDDTNSGVVESFIALGNTLAIEGTSLDMSEEDGVYGYCDTDDLLDQDEAGTLWVTLSTDGNVDLSEGVTATVSAPGISFYGGDQISFPPAELGETTSGSVPLKLMTSDSGEFKTITLTLADPNPDDGVTILPDSLSFQMQVDIDLTRTRTLDDFEQPTASERDWSTIFTGGGSDWMLTNDFVDSFDSSMYYIPDNGTTSDASLVTPPIMVGNGSFGFGFDHYYAFELNQSGTTVRGYDGGVIEISVNGGAWTDVFDAGAAVTQGDGYSGTLRSPSRPAFVGEINDVETAEHVEIDFGTALVGTSVRLRFRQLTDAGVGAFGWLIDNVGVTGESAAPFLEVLPDDGVCVNRAPYAVAPADFSAPERADGSTEQATISLAGSVNDLDEGQPITFKWVQTAGPNVSLSGADQATASFVAPVLDDDAQFKFALTVNDGSLQSSDSVTVTVTNVETPPTVVVESFSVPERSDGASSQAMISISGTATDPDGTAGLSYAWSQTGGPTVELDNAGSTTASFMSPKVDLDTPLTFLLTATDLSGLSGTGEMTVTVLNVESPPTAIAPDDFSAPERASEAAARKSGLAYKATQATITLDGDGTDPDGDELSYAWTQTGGPTVELIDADSEDASFVAPAVTADTPLTFVLTVNDGTSEHADEVVVTILNVNAAPVAVAAVVGEDFEAGDTVTLDGSGSSDPDDEPFAYAWTQTDGPEVMLSDASAAMPTFVAASAGTYGFSLSVTDEEGASSTATTTLTVAAAPVPPPVDNDDGGGGDGGAFGLATLAGLAALLALRRRRVFGHSLH